MNAIRVNSCMDPMSPNSGKPIKSSSSEIILRLACKRDVSLALSGACDENSHTVANTIASYTHIIKKNKF